MSKEFCEECQHTESICDNSNDTQCPCLVFDEIYQNEMGNY